MVSGHQEAATPIPLRKFYWMSIKSLEPTQNHYGVRSSICCPYMRFSKPTGKVAMGIPKLKLLTAGRKDAQAALQDKITALEKDIQDSVLDVAQRTLDKLREMAPELASELTPRFKEKPKWTFNFTLDGENGIPINKRGSGIRRLSLLNFSGLRLRRMSWGRPEM